MVSLTLGQTIQYDEWACPPIYYSQEELFTNGYIATLCHAEWLYSYGYN